MAASYRRISLSIIVALLVGTSLFGCGDGTVNTNVDQSRSGDNGDNSAPQLSDQYFLVPAGETHLVGNVTESVTLKVFLYSKSTGDPVPNQNIAYSIVDAGTAQDATVSALNSTTNEQGAASVDLRLGASEGTVKVRAENDSSNSVDFTVDVTPLATGNIELSMVNTGASMMPLSDIDLRLYRAGDYTCAEFRPLTQRQDGELTTYVAGTPQETVHFDDLGVNQRYMITAVAKGDAGQIAGAGCIEDIGVQADQTTHKELPLQLIPLNPVGRYDVTSHWDFTHALEDSGTVGSTIVRVLNIFQNPGQALYDEFINLIQNFVGGLASGGLNLFLNVTGLDNMLINAINNAIAGNDTLRHIRDAGRDLRDVVANLEVHSELTIGKMSSDYEFRGTNNWLGITLYWRWNCDANSPPDCGAINIQADGNGDFGQLGVLSSEWTGRVVAYNQLQIDTHPLSLRYGRLIIYVLNQVIIPQITNGNAHSLSEAFTYWVCDGLVGAIANGSGQVCAPDPFNACFDAMGYCQSAVSTVFGFADMLVSNLEYDVGLRVGGQAKLVETTSDGFVDEITDGVFNGVMQNADLGQQQGSQVSADWTGTRIDFDTNNL